ncbi:hypothetical protein RCC89_15965 [Cytophagaceae bacterium ABcell3]|nr:hypothetical protein RCC89_15965 [Cytophagaceae bacterium ABcell3]
MNAVENFRQVLLEEFSGLEQYVQKSALLAEKHKATDFTPFFIRNALFTTIWSFSEFSLRRYCEILTEDNHGLAKRVRKLNRIYQFHEFLKNDLQFELGHVQGEWEKLELYKGVRNCLVHHPTKVKDVHPRTYEFIKNDARILFEEPDFFRIVEVSLVFDLLDVSKKYLLGIMLR